MQFLKKSTLLILTLTISVSSMPSLDARGTNIIGFIWGALAITATALGISALCRACTWSDRDVINWVETGTDALEMKYSQIDISCSQPIQELRYFGRQNSTSTFWRSELERVAIINCSLVPLHNAKIIINDDLKEIQKYLNNIDSYNLHRYPPMRSLVEKLHMIKSLLAELQKCILKSYEYGEEEKILHDKLHQLHIDSLTQERNNALHEQNRLQQENNKIQKQKLYTPDVTIINIDTY